MGTSILNIKLFQISVFFLLFCCIVPHSFSQNNALSFPFCSREDLKSSELSPDWISEFEIFKKVCDLKCEEKIGGLFSAWAITNGYSGKDRKFCFLGTVRPNEENRLWVGIFFQDIKFNSWSENFRLPNRYSIQGNIFGPSFLFSSDDIQLIDGHDLFPGPEKKKIICWKIEGENFLKNIENSGIDELIGKIFSIYLIVNSEGKIEKWWPVGDVEEEDGNLGKSEIVKQKLFFLENFKIIYPKKVTKYFNFGIFVPIGLEVKKNRQGNFVLQIEQECGDAKWIYYYVINRDPHGKWKKKRWVIPEK